MIIHPDKSRHPTVSEVGIFGFFDEFRWLSNFHLCQIEFEGLIYPSTENAYQAAKTYSQSTRLQLSKCTPGQSKKLAHGIPLERENWDEIRVGIMMLLQVKKYSQPDLRDKLLMTDGYYLEETNNWGDKFWGVVNNDGKNMLGHCIMLCREHIKSR